MLTLDTNIAIYAVDGRDALKQQVAAQVMAHLQNQDAPLSLQVVGEFYAATTRRLKRPPWEAAQAARNLATVFPIFQAVKDDTLRALAEAASGRLSYWDGLLLATAERNGCTYIFSEDMQDGLKLGKIEVVNPFAETGLSARAADILVSRE